MYPNTKLPQKEETVKHFTKYLKLEKTLQGCGKFSNCFKFSFIFLYILRHSSRALQYFKSSSANLGWYSYKFNNTKVIISWNMCFSGLNPTILWYYQIIEHPKYKSGQAELCFVYITDTSSRIFIRTIVLVLLLSPLICCLTDIWLLWMTQFPWWNLTHTYLYQYLCTSTSQQCPRQRNYKYYLPLHCRQSPVFFTLHIFFTAEKASSCGRVQSYPKNKWNLFISVWECARNWKNNQHLYIFVDKKGRACSCSLHWRINKICICLRSANSHQRIHLDMYVSMCVQWQQYACENRITAVKVPSGRLARCWLVAPKMAGCSWEPHTHAHAQEMMKCKVMSLEFIRAEPTIFALKRVIKMYTRSLYVCIYAYVHALVLHIFVCKYILIKPTTKSWIR